VFLGAVMQRFTGKSRLIIALLQYAVFNIGLSHTLQLPDAKPHPPAIEADRLGGLSQTGSARNPPRWPGKNKYDKGLAIREASATNPHARVL
jgi:hypothetical protein